MNVYTTRQLFEKCDTLERLFNNDKLAEAYDALHEVAHIFSECFQCGEGREYTKEIKYVFASYISTTTTHVTLKYKDIDVFIIDVANGEIFKQEKNDFVEFFGSDFSSDDYNERLDTFDAKMPHVCVWCGELTFSNKRAHGGDSFVCDDCIECRDMRLCEECGCYSTHTEILVIFDDENNEESERRICDGCLFELSNKVYCAHHHRYEWYKHGHAFIDTENGFICQKAVEEMEANGQKLEKCECCGKFTFSIRRKRDLNRKIIKVCRDCYHDLRDVEFNHGMFGYSYKPIPIFHDFGGRSYLDKNGMFFGVELETDSEDWIDRDKVAERIELFTGEKLCYCKNDGSLDEGIEIVTQPMSFDFINHYDWNSLFDLIKEENLDSMDTCGFHIHINKNALGDTDLEKELAEAKIACIFDTFYEQLVKVARREHYNAERWAAPNNGGFTALDSDDDVLRKKKKFSEDRYRAVNTTNRNTVEIRLWASTLSRTEFVSTVYITKRIAEMARDCSMETLLGLSWVDFKNEIMKDCPIELGYGISYLLNLA